MLNFNKAASTESQLTLVKAFYKNVSHPSEAVSNKR